MKFHIEGSKVTKGLKKSIHADDKYKGTKLDYHRPGNTPSPVTKKI